MNILDLLKKAGDVFDMIDGVEKHDENIESRNVSDALNTAGDIFDVMYGAGEHEDLDIPTTQETMIDICNVGSYLFTIYCMTAFVQNSYDSPNEVSICSSIAFVNNVHKVTGYCVSETAQQFSLLSTARAGLDHAKMGGTFFEMEAATKIAQTAIDYVDEVNVGSKLASNITNMLQ